MKLKALELLEQISTEWCISDANILIDEAIKELEELENRSCFGCKHSSKTVSGAFCMCFSIYPDFEYCSDWKVK